METQKITAIVVAYRRVQQTIQTIAQLKSCTPPPDEIFVSVDGNEHNTYEQIKTSHPDIRINLSEKNIGPGGNRNFMIRNAKHPLIASFDDDSYPIEKDYFRILVKLFENYPQASVLYSSITEKNPTAPALNLAYPAWSKFFVGCGCAYRKKDFVETAGYASLPLAYGCEESDLALQLHDQGKKILFCPELKVYHNTDMTHHASAGINAASLSNLALLAYLRYPVVMWPYVGLQILNRIKFLIQKKRFAGILKGIVRIPGLINKHKKLQKRLSLKSFLEYLRMPSTQKL